ncbi:uncharacterized protein LOC116158726 [Photinus pyralis]|uniref:uncharacterized protein LOC116158726 n=1 Tax=Photinus pyralis TaxID=7054 RepID=UPI001266E72D|nr:uncharacterized protein LOC116158726 [Photinus pyralis]
MDGTFDAVPGITLQLYTIHSGIVGTDKFLPCVYACMMHKNKESYITLFNCVKKAVKTQYNKLLELLFVAVDFEKAAISAIKECFKGAAISGCLFHFSQILWRRLQSIGLQSTYQTKDEQELRSSFHSLIALAFVPVEDIEKVFDDVVDSCDERVLEKYDTGNVNSLDEYFPHM